MIASLVGIADSRRESFPQKRRYVHTVAAVVWLGGSGLSNKETFMPFALVLSAWATIKSG